MRPTSNGLFCFCSVGTHRDLSRTITVSRSHLLGTCFISFQEYFYYTPAFISLINESLARRTSLYFALDFHILPDAPRQVEIFVYLRSAGGCSFSTTIEQILYLSWFLRQALSTLREMDRYPSCSTRQMLVPTFLEADVNLSHFNEDLWLLYHTMRTFIPYVSQIRYLLHLPRSEDHTFERRLCIIYTCIHAPQCWSLFTTICFRSSSRELILSLAVPISRGLTPETMLLARELVPFSEAPTSHGWIRRPITILKGPDSLLRKLFEFLIPPQ